jgi:hypothetical protein
MSFISAFQGLCSCQRDPGHLVSFIVGMANKNYPRLPLMASLAILCQARLAKWRIWPNTGMHMNEIHAMLRVYKWRCVMLLYITDESMNVGWVSNFVVNCWLQFLMFQNQRTMDSRLFSFKKHNKRTMGSGHFKNL